MLGLIDNLKADLRKEFATKLDISQVKQENLLMQEENSKATGMIDLLEKKIRDLQEKSIGNSNMIATHSELIEDLQNKVSKVSD